MNIIKLSAIDSTNDYLKNLSNTQNLDNFTIVVADFQTKGKGQRGNSWCVEQGKNLTFSVLIKDLSPASISVFDLNIVISISVFRVLNRLEIPKLNIKWPNDILSEGKKIAGILIENLITSHDSFSSVVGIGLNVNQTDFQTLPKASSLKKIMGYDFDKDEIMLAIANEIRATFDLISTVQLDTLWQDYHDCLFRKDVPSVFEYPSGVKFMGMIKQVNKNGQLRILLEDDSEKDFDIKEVALVY